MVWLFLITCSKKRDIVQLTSLLPGQTIRPSGTRDKGKKSGTVGAYDSLFRQSGWFKRWPWIHYDEGKDVAYCFHCIKAYKAGKLHSVGSIEAMFILKTYSNWKEAALRFSSHETTSCINAHI